MQKPIQPSGSSIIDELNKSSVISGNNQPHSQNKVNIPSTDNVQVKPPDLDQISTIQTKPTQTITLDTEGLSIGEQLDYLVENLGKKTGPQLAVTLENIKNKIQTEIGYVSIISPIINTIADLSQITGLISLTDEQGFVNRIKFWKKKLNI